MQLAFPFSIFCMPFHASRITVFDDVARRCAILTAPYEQMSPPETVRRSMGAIHLSKVSDKIYLSVHSYIKVSSVPA